MKLRMRKRHGAAVAAGLIAVATALAFPAAASATTPSCRPNVNNSGLSAAVVAVSGQTIKERHIATACDIGIFVGPGTSHVMIDDVTVTGAGFQGILVEDASHVTVQDSIVTGNGFRTIDNSVPALPGSGVHSRVSQAFGISLFGVTGAWVRDNTVRNNGRGGIGIMDNGANNPGTITQDKNAKLVGSTDVWVMDNMLTANYNGCGIVAATQNVDGHLSDLRITGNTIVGTGMSKTKGPDIGGIVVAADLPNSWVRDALVGDNTVRGSFEGGAIVNAEAPGSSTDNVIITGNRLRANNWGKQEAPSTAGVVVFAGTHAMNMRTNVAGNTITDQFYGVWSMGKNPPKVFGNLIRVLTNGVVFAHS